MIERLCIVGVGLIGGSLARALREANAVREIVGASRDAEHLQRAVDLGVIDRFDTDIPAAVQGADMVFLSVPLGAMRKVFELIKGSLPDHAVVTDGGSAKSCVVTDVAAVWGEVPAWFVPGHPIAGTERSGVEASFAELYRGKRVILTPTASTAADGTPVFVHDPIEEGAYEGSVSSEMGSMPVSDVTIDGQTMSFVVDSPEMTVFFNVVFEGADFSGEFDAGGMGGFVSGKRRVS